jgi:RNA polymerase sigma-70 factor (ECF subfamily)
VQLSVENEAKFRTAFDAHYDAVARYCLRRIAAGEVNDVVADVFVIAWRKIDAMPHGDSALPWLYAVARNELRNRHRSALRLRRLGERAAAQGAGDDPGPEPVVVARSEYRDLMAALRTLRRGDQEVLLLRTQEELGYEQIALVIGSTPEAARKRVARALQRLRRIAGIPDPAPMSAPSRAIEEGGDR